MTVKTKGIMASVFARAWLLYFLFTIALVGGLVAYLVTIPLYVMGRCPGPLGRHFTSSADFVLVHGIRSLMAIQPWLSADIDLEIKKDLERPGRGRLLVSNHRSHLDAFILLSRVSGVRILAKSTLFYIPFLGLMMRMSRQIPVPRGRLDAFFTAMREVGNRLRSGETVHIFPEMTRCEPGQGGTRNFSLAPFSIAMQENAQVIPIVFFDTDLVWPKGGLGLNFRRPVQVRKLAPIEPTQFKSAEELRNEVRSRIDRLLRPRVNPEPTPDQSAEPT